MTLHPGELEFNLLLPVVTLAPGESQLTIPLPAVTIPPGESELVLELPTTTLSPAESKATVPLPDIILSPGELDSIPPLPTVTLSPEEVDGHLTAVIDGIEPEDGKDKDRLAKGLAIGLGAGMPGAGLVRWIGQISRTLSKLGKLAKGGGSPLSAVTDTPKKFRMDMSPHYNFDPKPKPPGGGEPGGSSPASEVAESVDEWYDDLCRGGNTGKQAAEIINNFKADMAKAESSMAGQAADVESVVDAAAGATFNSPSALNSWGVQAAAQVASTPGTGAEEIANALLKAGVPPEAVESTARAVSDVVRNAPKGWIGWPAYNSALGVISTAVTSAGMAASEAAKAAVNGATGPGLAWSLGPASVLAAAADATAAAVVEAVQAARASGAVPIVAAINAISKATCAAGRAAASTLEGASGSALHPTLAAGDVPPEALTVTADAVSAAISANGASASAALNAATDIVAAASAPYGRMSSPASPVSPVQGALDVVGASFNFWHVAPWVVWDALKQLKDEATDASDIKCVDSVLTIGPPPDFTSRFPTFPYRRGGNRVTSLPSLPTDAVRLKPPSTQQGAPNGTSSHTATQSSTPPILNPAPPGTGGYLYDNTKPAPSAGAKALY